MNEDVHCVSQLSYRETNISLYSTFITWPSPKAGQVLKCRRLFNFLEVKMVIGWIHSCDLFETSWEGLHEVLPIVITEESRMFICVCFHCLSGVVTVTLNRLCRIRTYTPSVVVFGWDDSHYYAHTKAKYTGIMPVLLFIKSIWK